MKKLIATILFTIFLALGNGVAFGSSHTDSIKPSQMDTICVLTANEAKVPEMVFGQKGKDIVLRFVAQEQEQDAVTTQEPWFRSTLAVYIMMALLIVALILSLYANLDNTNVDDVKKEIMNDVDKKIREITIKPIQKPQYSKKEVGVGVPGKSEAQERIQTQVPGKTNKKGGKERSNACVANIHSHETPDDKNAEEKRAVLYATTGDNDMTLELVEKSKFSKEIFIIHLNSNDQSKGTYEVIDDDKIKEKFANNSDEQKFCKCEGQGNSIVNQKPGKVENIDKKNMSAKITEMAIIKLG